MARPNQKIAVVLIHGIGDQRPMETLRSFVAGILRDQKPKGDNPLFWSKPDHISGSFELRRLNAYPGGRHPPCDFYEFYWAHLMHGNTIAHALEWIAILLLRWPSRVPGLLRKLWGLVWFAVLTAVAVLVALGGWRPEGLLLAVVVGFLAVAKSVTRNWIADAARYFNASPHNVEVRQAIRSTGVEMLRKLHASGEYHRIVVVGHSLGSAIAVDILYHYWVEAHEIHNKPDTPRQPVLEAFEVALLAAPSPEQTTIRQFQKALWQEERATGLAWLVTDLVTLGSPLTHLPFLIDVDEKGFDEIIAQRELPACPPILDAHKLSHKADYESISGQPRTMWQLHHAACFAVTRWTNIYFPHDGWFKGDPVGGPLSSLFGKGIQDVKVETAHWKGRLAHTRYWAGDAQDRGKEAEPLEALKKAMNLEESFRGRPKIPAAEDMNC
jgi:Lipase (class 3)